MKTPPSQYKNILAQRLQNHARKIEAGGGVKPGILVPLRYLFRVKEFEKEFSLAIFRLVCKEVESLLQNNERNKTLLTDMNEVLTLCSYYLKSPNLNIKNELLQLREKLYQSQPGWKRVWVHATRRRARDKYALLTEVVIESVLLVNSFDMGLRVTRLYVFDYIDYRYRVSDLSSNRLRNVAEVLLESAKTE